MTDKPILFSAPMIRALLAGTKTQTRRVLKLPKGFPCHDLAETDPEFFGHLPITSAERWGYSYGDDGGPLSIADMAPHARGDRLWVREAWAVKRCEPCLEHERDWQSLSNPTIRYLADGAEISVRSDRASGKNIYHGAVEKGRPSIHMPRWASRLTLIVTDVRVQRLQEISEEDAESEGCNKQWYADEAGSENLWPCSQCNGYQFHRALGANYGVTDVDCRSCDTSRGMFKELWNSINGPDAWDASPWVAVYGFKTYRCNIDRMEAELERAD